MSATTDDAERLFDWFSEYTKTTAEQLDADELVIFVRGHRSDVAVAFKYDHGRVLIAHADADGFHGGFSAIGEATTLEDHTDAARKLAQADAGDGEPDGAEKVHHVAAMLLDFAERIPADEVVYYVRRSERNAPELACRYLRGKLEVGAGPASAFARAHGSFARAAPTDMTERIDERLAMREKARALVSGDEAQDRIWAKLLALAVRNGVEDLRAAGAFSDDEAPAFDRLVRDRLYEALAVLRAADDAEPGSPVMNWVIEHFDPEPDDGFSAAAPNACEDAIETFAGELGLDDETTAALVAAGLAGLDTAIDCYLRRDDEDAQCALTLMLQSLPDDGEEPQLRAEVAALLAADG